MEFSFFALLFLGLGRPAGHLGWRRDARWRRDAGLEHHVDQRLALRGGGAKGFHRLKPGFALRLVSFPTLAELAQVSFQEHPSFAFVWLVVVGKKRRQKGS